MKNADVFNKNPGILESRPPLTAKEAKLIHEQRMEEARQIIEKSGVTPEKLRAIAKNSPEPNYPPSPKLDDETEELIYNLFGENICLGDKIKLLEAELDKKDKLIAGLEKEIEMLKKQMAPIPA